ncbi:MAG: hypothetical protein VB064_08880 [Oscillospiraceae bacterium]|nr:hypothetical protein [Oscillospiraceae bacterium]
MSDKDNIPKSLANQSIQRNRKRENAFGHNKQTTTRIVPAVFLQRQRGFNCDAILTVDEVAVNTTAEGGLVLSINSVDRGR